MVCVQQIHSYSSHKKKKKLIINKLNSYPKLLNCNVQKETYIESRQL